ncbi:MAG: protease modulator HflK [Pseudomonadota bacterium]
MAVIALAAYAATGIYEVKPEESGVAYVFGRIVNAQVPSGIHWNFPAPIGRQVQVPTRQTQVLTIGDGGRNASIANLPNRQDLWFTGGTSVIQCRLEIQYSIGQLDQYLLSHDDPEAVMSIIVERAVTRFLAGLHVDDILTTARQSLVTRVSAAVQDELDAYELGINVQDLSIVHLAPPLFGGVSDAFRKVQSARSDRDRDIEEARSGASRIRFDAQAEAESVRSQSQAEQYARVEQARAEAQRFIALARERAIAPQVTETRLFRDILPAALQRAKIYVVPDNAAGVTVE